MINEMQNYLNYIMYKKVDDNVACVAEFGIIDKFEKVSYLSPL